MDRRLRFSLVGHPVRHSVSPAMCTAAFAALGLPHVYTAIDVPTEAGLGRILDELRGGLLAGCNVTLPYKRAMLALADTRAESTREAGAANVLSFDPQRGVIAHNTDAEALAQELDALLSGTAGADARPPTPRLRAAVIGGGGAGLAAVAACRRLGFKVICMTSRSWIDTEAVYEAPAARTARSLGALTAPWPRPDEAAAPSGKLSQALRLQWSELVAHADCVIQATSAGMSGGDPGEDVSSVVAWDRLPPHAIAYDVVYNPRVTPFLRAARARGLVASDGLGMLVRQAGLAITIWTGKSPPLERMRRAAEEALEGGEAMSEVRFEEHAGLHAGAGGRLDALDAGASPWPSVLVDGDFTRARKEWLHTNGAGAYASSTLAGMHSRRYHGLLVAALDPPRARHVLLSHVDVTVARPRGASPSPGARPSSRPSWGLAKHQFPGLDPSSGPFHLRRFDQDPLPRWTYALPDGELEVTLALVRGENAVVLRYVWRGREPMELTLRPLLAARHFHQLQREHGGMVQRVELRPGLTPPGGANGSPPASAPGEMRVQPRRELPRVCFRYEGTFVGSPDWWRRFEYLAERDRGLEYEEDLWTPGVFEVSIDHRPCWLIASVDKLPSGEPEALLEATRAAILAEDPGPSAPLLQRRLTIAAETFRADLARSPGVVAGYPWFEVWGRDALAALPGLYLVPGKIAAALSVLRGMIGAMKDGLVPARIPEPGPAPAQDGAPPPSRARLPSPGEPHAGEAPSYGCADATLWLFEAARHVADTLGDAHPFVTGELVPALRDAFEAALRGTTNGIHVTADGLFAAGAPGDALTWMAARVRDKPVTPRAGCPVELSALWARGCDTLARLADAAGDTALHDRAAAECRRTRLAFRDRFWCAETGYPHDVISEAREGPGAFKDPSIRPNAVVALAVDPACFSPEQAASILDRALRELVTRAGLRTLAPSDPAYVGRYAGGPASRDAAYHQGTAWPWLLGFYVRAAVQRLGAAGGADGEGLVPFLRSLVACVADNELAVGLVPELSGGDPPHAPGGAVAHAWSVAELLRALAWDLPRGAP